MQMLNVMENIRFKKIIFEAINRLEYFENRRRNSYALRQQFDLLLNYNHGTALYHRN